MSYSPTRYKKLFFQPDNFPYQITMIKSIYSTGRFPVISEMVEIIKKDFPDLNDNEISVIVFDSEYKQQRHYGIITMVPFITKDYEELEEYPDILC